MAGFSDELTSTFPCPHCGYEITETLVRLQGEPVLTCPMCGKRYKIESDGTIGKTVDELNELDRAWDKLTKK